MSQKAFKIRLKAGDKVIIRAGKYKGQTGKVLKVHSAQNKVTVEGINVVKKHRKPSQALPQGGIVELTKPLWVSKVGLVDESTRRPSRIGYKIDKSGKKLRVLKPSGREVKNG